MILRIFLLACLVFITGAAVPSRPFMPIVYEQAVQIRIPDGYGICSGSIVEDGLVLTAAHCITDKDMDVMFFDGVVSRFKLVYKGVGNGGPTDFAFLSGNTRGIEPLQISKDLPDLPVATAYIAYNPIEGIIGTLLVNIFEVKIEDGKFILHFTGAPIGGDSGSPILNKQGQVIGVVVASYVWSDVGIAASSFFFTPIQSQLQSHTH